MIDTGTAYLSVTVCDRRYALHIDEVVEVAAIVESASMMEAGNPALHGVVIRRGEPLILIDLRHLFECDTAPIDLNTLFVVVQHQGELVGLIVDHVAGVVYLDVERFQGRATSNAYIHSVSAHEGELMSRLNLPAVLADTLPESE